MSAPVVAVLALGALATASNKQGAPPRAAAPTARDAATIAPAPAPESPGALPAPPAASDPADAGETVVRVRRRPRAVTSARTSAAEARALPGTQGDAVRVVESLPGVGRSSFGSGALILWGAAPEASRTYVDGVPIPLLFHGGALRSTLNGAFVSNIELTPGAYSAEYGRATAGMVQIETAPGREGLHGSVAADVLDGSVVGSAQPDRRVFVSAGFRQGYIDQLAPLVASPDALQYVAVPQYRDYQLRGEFRASDSERASLFLFGSQDVLANRFVTDDAARARATERATSFHRLVLRYNRQVSDGRRVALTLWAGLDEQLRRESVGAERFELDTTARAGGLRASWLETLGAGVRLNAGLDLEFWATDLFRRGSLLRPARAGDVFVFGQAPAGDVNADRWSVAQLSAAPFLELPLSLLHDRLVLVPGLRVDGTVLEVSRQLPPAGDTPPHGASRLLAALEPRATVSFRVLDALTLRAGFGVYNAPPAAADLSAVFGNPALGYTRSLQYVAGAAVQLAPPLSLELVGFLRTSDGVVSRATSAQARPGAALVPTGTAQAYGAQLALRHQLARGFTAWLSYTLSRSEVTDRPGAATRLSDYDQTHLLTAVASYQLPLGFTAGARFRLASGLPRTPVVGATYDTLSGDYQPVFGAVNSDRLPLVTSLDLRVDRVFRLGRGAEITVFLDVLNVLNQARAEEVTYDATYTQRAYISGLPIVADLGVRGEL
jgi:hypothetical protein